MTENQALSGQASRGMCGCWSYNLSFGTTPPILLDAPDWAGRDRPIEVDACIAPVVEGLWAAGVQTLGSCCGHGRSAPSLVLGAEDNATQVRNLLAENDPARRHWRLFRWQLQEV